MTASGAERAEARSITSPEDKNNNPSQSAVLGCIHICTYPYIYIHVVYMSGVLGYMSAVLGYIHIRIYTCTDATTYIHIRIYTYM